LDFERRLLDTEFIPIMRELLRTVEDACQHPVDIEFTANSLEDGRLRVNLLQCRPFQVKINEGGHVQFPEHLAD
jgi:hypothetical protein